MICETDSVCAFVLKKISTPFRNVSVCCKHGNGGPIELFDGPIEDNKLLFEDAFIGTTRKAFTFTRQGDAVPSSSCWRGPFWGRFAVSFALAACWML